MPRGSHLSLVERTKIDLYRESGRTIRDIALTLNRSKTTIQNYVKNPTSYGTLKRCGRHPKVSDRDKRSIKRLAVTNNFSCGQIKAKLCLNITPRRINQILNNNLHITKQKTLPKPKITPRHKDARLAFAEKYKFWEEEWKNVLFSDEKSLTLTALMVIKVIGEPKVNHNKYG